MRKKTVALVLAVALVFGESVPYGVKASNEVGNEKTNEKTNTWTVTKEEYQFTDTEREIVEKSIKEGSGSKAAEMLNGLGTEAFESAVKKVLDEYYEDDGSVAGQIYEFSKTLDSRADEILKDYSAAADERKNADNLNYDTEKILVTFDSSVSDRKIDELVHSMADDGEIINNLYGMNEDLPEYKKQRIQKAYEKEHSKIVSVKIGKSQTTRKAISRFADLGEVEYAGRNEKTETTSSVQTNDTYLPQQWYLDRINTSDAWEALDKANDTVEIWVAVIDSGVDVNHEDLKGKFLKEYSVDITGDKPINLYDMEKPYVTDHGTEVSGILMAKANNSKGIAGVAGKLSSGNFYGSRIMAIQAGFVHGEWERDFCYFTVEDEMKAVKYAVDNGAEIINMSLGGAGSPRKDFQQLINFATEAGVFIVAAAGNEDTNEQYYPSDYEHVFSVIATDKNNKRADYSNYGKNKDISAPGDSNFTCKPDNIYESPEYTGTSHAAPMVSAAAAMMKSVNYYLSPQEIENILEVTATDLGTAGRDNQTGYGLLNAGLAVQHAIYNSYSGTKPKIYSISSTSPNSVLLKWKHVYNEEHVLIYRSESENKDFVRVGKVEGENVSFTDTKLTSGKKYYYKIRFRSTYGSGRKYGQYSDVVSCVAS